MARQLKFPNSASSVVKATRLAVAENVQTVKDARGSQPWMLLT